MSSDFYESLLGRPMSWVILIGNVGFVGLFIAASMIPELITIQRLMVSSLAVTWSAICVTFAVHTLYRPRLEASDFEIISADSGVGFSIPVRRRVTAVTSVSALTMSVSFVVGAVVAHGGWRVLLSIVGVLLGIVVVNEFAMLRRPRWLILNSIGIDIGGSRRAGSLAWDDITEISWVLGTNGQMSYRLRARPDANSFASTWRHPLARPHPIVDIETLSIDLDPLLLGVALWTYWKDPSARYELGTTAASQRFLDPSFAMTVSAANSSGIFTRYRPR